jgi:hypothetical protein
MAGATDAAFTDAAATTVGAVIAEASAGADLPEGAVSLVDHAAGLHAMVLQAASEAGVTSTEAVVASTAVAADFTAAVADTPAEDFTAVAGTAAVTGN